MKPLLAALASLVTLAMAGCTSGSSPEANPSAAPSAERVSPAPAIAIDELQGKILFTRAGYNYGDETVFTAAADGTNERRITGVGMTCCPRWSPDGKHILMAASSPDGRITTQIVDPDGSHLRIVPLPPGTLNLECAQALSLVTGRLACVGYSDTKSELNGVYTVRASDGGGVVQLTHCSEECRVFDFSPDGSEIFFFRAVEGFPMIGDQPGGSLFVISAEGQTCIESPTLIRPLKLRETPGEGSHPMGNRSCSRVPALSGRSTLMVRV